MSNTRNLVKTLPQKFLVPLGPRYRDFKKVIIIPSRQIDLKNFWNFRKLGPHLIDRTNIVLIQDNLNHSHFGVPQKTLIQLGRVLRNIPILF